MILFFSKYRQLQALLYASFLLFALAAGVLAEEFSGTVVDGVRQVTMTARRYRFDPSVITVHYGERVRLLVTSMDTTHGIAISEFGVNEVLPKGKTVTVEFVASQRGSFNFHCSVYCGPGHARQRGRLIVR